jgi:hypothetical protein
MMNNQKKYQSRSGPTVSPAPVGRSKERLKLYRLENVEETTKSSAGTDGPSSQGSSIVGSGSVTGLGLTDTCMTGGHPSQT